MPKRVQYIKGVKLPRLKRFKDVAITHPASMTEKEWDECLDEMIFALEFILDNEGKYDEKRHIISCIDIVLRSTHYDRAQNGLELLGKHWMDLWW